jgi:hypothetical protein
MVSSEEEAFLSRKIHIFIPVVTHNISESLESESLRPAQLDLESASLNATCRGSGHVTEPESFIIERATASVTEIIQPELNDSNASTSEQRYRIKIYRGLTITHDEIINKETLLSILFPEEMPENLVNRKN